MNTIPDLHWLATGNCVANLILKVVFTAVAAAAAAVTVYQFVCWIQLRPRKKRLERQDPPRYPHRDPFGYDLYSARNGATTAGRSATFDKSLFDR